MKRSKMEIKIGKEIIGFIKQKYPEISPFNLGEVKALSNLLLTTVEENGMRPPPIFIKDDGSMDYALLTMYRASDTDEHEWNAEDET